MKTAINATHTPGPWSLSEEDNLQSEIYDRNGELLATAYPMKRDGIHDSWIGNARLIAAAPEMLEALELAVKDCACTLKEKVSGHRVDCFAPACLEAIQKAKGGQ